MHEASLNEHNVFLTLTYDDEHLPKGKTLVKSDLRNFLNRLRNRAAEQLKTRSEQNREILFEPKMKETRANPDGCLVPGIRYYAAGEYGERFGRPHYHAILFNCDFRDKTLFKAKEGQRLYTSEYLNDVWNNQGYAVIGNVTFESAAYVARYIMKKVTGDAALHHYNEIDMTTGEVLYERIPEYTVMSRDGGIGIEWFKKYKDEVYNHDHVIVRGRKNRPPRYYDTLYEKEYPSDLKKIKERRKQKAQQHASDQTPDRLATREKVQSSRLKRLPRNLDQ